MTCLHFEHALLPEGWASGVRITVDERGLIAAVESGIEDARCEGVAVPGVPNAHSHAFQRAMAGLAESGGDSFWSWRSLMYRFLQRLHPEQVQAVAAQAYVEMLESGFTHVAEFHYLHHDPEGRPYAERSAMATAMLEAADRTGVGITLLPVLYAHSDFGGVPPLPEQRRFVHGLDDFLALAADIERAARARPLARTGLALHSLRAVTPPQVSAVAAESSGRPVHIHVAEQQREVDACLAWSGQRPVRWLLEHAPLDRRWCLVHATHVDAGERAALARSGAVAALCPVTEANLGDGIFPATAFLQEGGRFAVGSDSNVCIDAAGELRLLEYTQRLAARARSRLAGGGSCGRTLLTGALDGGAAACGAPLGRIAPGARADLVSLDPEHPCLAAATGDAWLDAWVFAAGAGAVRHVWVHGRQQVRDGRHRAREAVRERYRNVVRRLRAAA